MLELSPAVRAADYPIKPVRMFIAFSLGGPSDILSRFIGGKLAEHMGQPSCYTIVPAQVEILHAISWRTVLRTTIH